MATLTRKPSYNNTEAATVGCGCMILMGILLASVLLFYVATYNLAEYFGYPGWVGLAIAFVASVLLNGFGASMRRSK